MKKLLATITIAAILAIPLGASAAPTEQEVQRLERMVARFKPIGPNTGARELFWFALEAAALEWRPDLVEEALSVAEQMQDRDAKSGTYGNFRWYWHNEKPQDLNAVQFSMERGSLLWMFHRDKLTPKAKESLERLIRLSVEGIRRHRVNEAYTNIFLMKTWNCIALGENCDMPELAQEGYAMLDRWLGYTWEAGIHEYLSPTYTGVDMPTLALIANHAKRERERQLAATILKYFWTDCAINWFEPAYRLGGAHSRDYDYIYGHGGVENYLQANGKGWADPSRKITPTVFDRYTAFPEPDGLRALMTTPRFVRQSWGAAPFENAAQYVGKNFSIGSAGATYPDMDKALVVNLPGGPRTPIVNFLMDGRMDPYGQNRFSLGKSGHSKSLHINPFLTRVQSGPEVLLLAYANPADHLFKRRAPNASCLLTHFVIPTEVRMYTGPEGAPVECVDRMPVGMTPFFIRAKDVAVGFRFLYATAENGGEPPVELVLDGGSHPVMRLTCIHANAAPEKPATVAVWVRAAEGIDDAAFADFRRAFADAPVKVNTENTRIDITVPGLAAPLRVAADLSVPRRIAGEGEEPDAEKHLLALNGKDLGRQMLADLEPVAKQRQMLEAIKKAESTPIGRAEDIVEAEATPLLVTPFVALENKDASGGKYATVPNDNPSNIAAARLAYILDIPQDGDYYLHARLLTPTPNDDSFFVAVEQDNHFSLPNFDWHTAVHTQWEWTALKNENGSIPIPLKKGRAKLTIRCREDGAAIDALVLTQRADWQPPAK